MVVPLFYFSCSLWQLYPSNFVLPTHKNKNILIALFGY